MSVSTAYDLTGKSQSIVIDAITTPVPTHTRGATAEYRCVFRPAGRTTSYTDRYLAARQYAHYPDAVDTGIQTTGEPWYYEDLPAGAPVDSQVVKIEPQSVDAAGVYEGLWGVVTGVSDETRLSNRHALTLEVFVLAEASDYADHAAVDDAFTSSII